ncbi:MAG: HEAT repeat domain-containing protein [Acidobacteriota bacterium]|nr:HEAT repeat domain-containing protein [Acidobacteriota bacterium]
MKFIILPALFCFAFVVSPFAQTTEQEIERRIIEVQVQKLKSADVETRRDAIYQLGLLRNAAASQAAAAALRDSAEIVRAEAARAVVYQAAPDAVRALLPLLTDKSEFVRREVAFALGRIYDKTAVDFLIKALQTDKFASVRGAAAVALGQIADERAIEPLSQVLLAPQTKQNKLIDEFVRRSAAKSLGQIRNKKAVPTLISALRDTTNADDIRREAARALGLIADESAVQVLQENLNAEDYYLAQIAADALEVIRHSRLSNPLF